MWASGREGGKVVSIREEWAGLASGSTQDLGGPFPPFALASQLTSVSRPALCQCSQQPHGTVEF